MGADLDGKGQANAYEGSSEATERHEADSTDEVDRRAALIQMLSKPKGKMPVTDLTAKAHAAMEKAGMPLKGKTPLATLAAAVYVLQEGRRMGDQDRPRHHSLERDYS
jgi:hypothetical protein